MFKVAYRPAPHLVKTAWGLSTGVSGLVTAVPMFGGTPSFEDIISGKEDKPINDVHARGNWGVGEDLDHSYRENANDFKLQERIRDVLRRVDPDQRKEQWIGVDEEGKRHEFRSFEDYQRQKQTDKRKWRSISKIAGIQQLANDRTAELLASALASCVMVESTPLTGGRGEIGSAFSIGNGLFVTCAHVIKRYNKLQLPANYNQNTAGLTLRQFGRAYPAILVAADLTLDIAVMRCQTNFPGLRLGSSENKLVGSKLVAVGSPRGFENNASMGILSSKNRKVFPHPNAPRYLFTDAQILPGNSGGPLISEDDGTVIGVISLIVAGEGLNGLNAALPSEQVTMFLKENRLL